MAVADGRTLSLCLAVGVVLQDVVGHELEWVVWTGTRHLSQRLQNCGHDLALQVELRRQIIHTQRCLAGHSGELSSSADLWVWVPTLRVQVLGLALVSGRHLKRLDLFVMCNAGAVVCHFKLSLQEIN